MTNIKNNKVFKYFILIMFVPIIGIITIFSSAYIYVNNEVKIVNQEINGLTQINQIQDLIFDMQQLRGLSNIAIKDDNCLLNIKVTKSHILVDMNIIRVEFLSKYKDRIIKQKVFKHLENINAHLKHTVVFEHLSTLIQESIMLIKHLSHNSKLILDPELQSYVLMETVVSILPELIEYNGQIRGVSSSIKDTLKTKEHYVLLTQLSKIDDKMHRLKFNMSQLCDNEDCIISTVYKNMLSAQNSLIDFTKKEILNKKKIMINSNDIFRLNSNNIEFITLLYQTNSQELQNILKIRMNDKENILSIIFFTAIISIIFIVFINSIFFRKNKEFINHIELLSITDAMTTLFNRRHFDSIFEKQQKIQQRAKQNLVFIMMDIDHFKQYNDTYGHQAGDDTLVAVSKSLKDDLKRPDDLAFRLGGEEFGVLCSNMTEKEALEFANKLRKNIQNLNIEHNGNSANKFVTISMGLIIIEPNQICKMDKIYKCADEALYTAKQNGRNQVSIYDTENTDSTLKECKID